jgi:hypothetical protein
MMFAQGFGQVAGEGNTEHWFPTDPSGLGAKDDVLRDIQKNGYIENNPRGWFYVMRAFDPDLVPKGDHH